MNALADFFPEPVFHEPKPFRRNKLLRLYCLLFPICWIITGATSTNFTNWLLENTPTVIVILILVFWYRIFALSNTSYTLIFIFMLLHLYGSQSAYAENPFGQWLKVTFHLHRNHYDRIVHFNFGFLAAYPIQEILVRLFKTKNWVAYAQPVVIILAVSAFYEIVEWLVADVFFPKIGPAFLGAQGDVWDSQKDMFLAALGAFLAALLLLFWRKRRLRNR